ncbi:MAG: cupin domain-containing protein [Oxalobacter formigenes]|nr:cupin domain-containing protein [Oxalobacter formigenes]
MFSSRQTISPDGSQASLPGHAGWFTGNVRIDPLFPATEESPVSGAYVTLEPGARSAWHIHPAGQTLAVISGAGLTQEWSGTIREIRPGDMVHCPSGIKHWHRASPRTGMMYMAITGTISGKNVQ